MLVMLNLDGTPARQASKSQGNNGHDGTQGKDEHTNKDVGDDETTAASSTSTSSSTAGLVCPLTSYPCN
jgi:hypothetical protein